MGLELGQLVRFRTRVGAAADAGSEDQNYCSELGLVSRVRISASAVLLLWQVLRVLAVLRQGQGLGLGLGLGQVMRVLVQELGV